MKQSVLRSYAKLVVKMGANVQKGQEVLISANVNDNYFVKYVVEECYKAKASRVIVDWHSDDITKLHYKYQSTKSLGEVLSFEEEKLKYEVAHLPARIYIDSDDPDLLKKINPNKIKESRASRGPIIMKYRNMIDNKYQWTIVGIPGEAWARKVFPDLPKSKAMVML